jgi:hypothetical protein
MPTRRLPPLWSIRQVPRGLLITLTFPGYLIWELAKYCNSQEGRLGKIGMFAVLSPTALKIELTDHVTLG